MTDVQLADIQIHSRGGAPTAAAQRHVPEMADGYPEPMLFGMLSSWGIYVRHAARIQMRNIMLRLLNADSRPAIELDDVVGADLTGIRLPDHGPAEQWVTAGLSRISVRDCDGRADAKA